MVAVGLEVRPAPRPAALLVHSFGRASQLEHVLSAGLGGFPDLELRTSLSTPPLGPLAPWLALRVRRIDLAGLPPVENYLAFGVGLASDPRRRLSLAGGFGVRLQLPPLTAEAAGDAATYFGENVNAELFFAARVRVW